MPLNRDDLVDLVMALGEERRLAVAAKTSHYDPTREAERRQRADRALWRQHAAAGALLHLDYPNEAFE